MLGILAKLLKMGHLGLGDWDQSLAKPRVLDLLFSLNE
jgi:hypothetical protein